MDKKLEILPWKILLQCIELELESREKRNPITLSPWVTLEKRLRRLVIRVLSGRTDVTPSDRDDIVQSILLQLQNLDLIRSLTKLRAIEGYLTTIVKNRANDLARKKAVERRAQTVSGADVFVPPDAFSLLEEEEVLHLLDRKLGELRDEDTELLRMRFWIGMTIQDIADRLNIRYSTAAVRIFRVLRKLESAIQDSQ